MNKRLITGLALGGALAIAGLAHADDLTNQLETGAKNEAKQLTGQGTLPVTGFVTKLDSGNHQLSIVASSASELGLPQVGEKIAGEKGVDVTKVNGSFDQNAPILRDGKQASFSDLKEGDMVRASFDQSKKSFVDVRAVSKSELTDHPIKAKSDLSATVPAATPSPTAPSQPSQNNMP